jgi:hypothetical protein
MENPKKRHSFFWPVILIGIGIIALLVNFNLIAPVSINTVLHFWPILLILLGLDILFGRRYSWVGGLFGILTVGLVIFFLVSGPRTAMTTSSQSQVDVYSEPLGNTSHVNYDFETSSEPVNITALKDSTDLMYATLAHQGTINFAVTGSTNKTVSLSENYDSNSWLNWNFSFDEVKWEIGLAPDVPADLTLDGGSGSINADLTGIQLESLTAHFGSGASTILLPESKTPIEVSLDSGSGSMSVVLPKYTTITLTLTSGSGAVHIDIPDDAEVRIEVSDSGSGSLSLPSSVTRVSGDVETGAWESAGYATAANTIFIHIVDRGSGSISID